MAITVEQVHRAADELAGQGINPTQVAVRKQLGGGSFSTIGEALKSWRAMRDTNAQLAEVIIPAEIGERAELLVAQIWEIAQSIANERLQNDRKALEHKESLIRAEIEELTAVIVALEEEQEKMTLELDSTKALLGECGTQKEQLQSELDKTRIECSNLHDKLTDNQKHAQELEKRVSELADENKAMVAEIARLSSRNQFKQDEIDRLTAEIGNKGQKHQAEIQSQLDKLDKHRHSSPKSPQKTPHSKGEMIR
ncbi:chromosome segregation protein SMC [Moraxella caprae]|uniref:Chromosome segregation protein SMC n=1 Tax=Moraxella caprae TaxID=90240 RepID=A0A378QL08_9GAMM|nr:DNA-binding protein [Moraxella caprae]STZ01579.1 chromosome segregation protein SMC [Moraxella caprae]